MGYCIHGIYYIYSEPCTDMMDVKWFTDFGYISAERLIEKGIAFHHFPKAMGDFSYSCKK